MSKTRSFSTLTDLPGRPGATRALNVTSRSDALRNFRKHDAITAAGPNGAINVWRIKYGFKAEFYRYMVPQNSRLISTRKSLNEWLQKWWPMMGDAA